MGWAVVFIGMMAAVFAGFSSAAWIALAVQRFYRLYEQHYGIHFPDPFSWEARQLDVMFDRQRRDREWAAVFHQRYSDGELEAARLLIVRRLMISLIIVGSMIAVVASLAIVADHFGGFETAKTPAGG